jgi:hypothetical protein
VQVNLKGGLIGRFADEKGVAFFATPKSDFRRMQGYGKYASTAGPKS